MNFSRSRGWGKQKPPVGTPLIVGAPINIGLVGRWLMAEGASRIITNSANNTYTGVLKNVAAPDSATSGWRPGKFGPCLALDGVDDYVSCGTCPMMNMLPYLTIYSWLNISVTGYGAVINKYTDGLGNGFFLYAGSSTVKQRFFVNGTSADSNTFLSAGKWQQIAVVYDEFNASFYLDGVADGVVSLVKGAIASTPNEVRIGANHLVTPSEFWPGIIDNISVYSRPFFSNQLYEEPFAGFAVPRRRVFPAAVAAVPQPWTWTPILGPILAQ